MKPVSIKLLGRCELNSPGGDGDTVINGRTALLLARLAQSPGQSHDRKRLAEQLWPDRGEVQALASLRQALWILRKAAGELDPPLVVADRSSVRLDPGAAEIDTLVFEHLVRGGGSADLERAAELYRGDYLSDIDFDDADSLGPFLFERQRLRDLHLTCLTSLIGLRAEAGEVDGAIEAAQRALAIDPLQEAVHAAIIRLHRDAGRPGLARQQYEACRDILRRDLGIAPSAEFEALRQSLGAAPSGPIALPVPPPVLAKDGAPLPAPPPRRHRLQLPLLLSGLAALVALVLAFSGLQSSRSELPIHRPVADPRPSLIVMPFRDISSGTPPAAFSAGVTDHLVNDLSKIPGLFVIASATSRSVDRIEIPPGQQASRLGVDYAVSGTVERSEDGLRVAVEMVHAGTGELAWTRHYDGSGSDLFAVQDDMVRSIAQALGVELNDRLRQAIAHVPTHNLEAQDFYLRAEYQTDGLNEADSLRRALAAYRRAIELDPGFADAYSGYARAAVAVWRHDKSEIMSSAVARHEAYTAAGKAMQIDPANARAYEVLSIIQAVEGEHQLAVASARQALSFEPGDAEAHTNLATVLFMAGDLEAAAAEVEIARSLNPALPADLRLVSALVAFAQHRYPVAIADFSAIEKSVPRSELVLEHLAASYAYVGDLEKARSIVRELLDVVPIANLGFYKVLSENIGTPEQTAHFLEGLRRAGIPDWPFGDRRDGKDRLSEAELRSVVAGPVWRGELANGVAFVQYFDRSGGFAYNSTTSLLTGRAELRGNQLCQVIGGYLLNRPTCGYVYRTSDRNRPAGTLAYVSIDAVKYFSVSQ